MDNTIILRTNEIPDQIWKQIVTGYDICFDLKLNINSLKEELSNTVTGYSLHALKFTEDGKLMAHNYYQPRPYLFNGEESLVCLSGGSFVLPEFRKDIFLFHDLCMALNIEAKKMGCKLGLSVSNENSFEYAVKLNGAKYIGDLHYYILPINISKILKIKNPFLNILSKGFSFSLTWCNLLVSNFLNFKEKIRPIRINRTETFMRVRFNSPQYIKLQKKDIKGIYRIYMEDNIRTAYILDFTEGNIKTAKSLNHIVNYILKNEKVDAILYIGTMNVKQMSLIKTPKKFIPHKLPLTYTIFDKKDNYLKEILKSQKNIDYSLLNFDVR